MSSLVTSWRRLCAHLSASDKVVTIFVIGLAVTWAAFALLRHQRLNSTAYDLAIQGQVIWNTGHGRWFASSIEVENYLGDHIQPIALLFAPLLRLWPDVRILLIVQSTLLAVAAFPLYFLAKRRLGSGAWGVVFVILFAFYPNLGFINRYDFHMLAFAIPCLLFAYEAIVRERWRMASLFLLLALFSREEVGLTICLLGLYVAWRHNNRRFGLTWAFLGLSWSLLSVGYLIPAARGERADTTYRYTWLGDGPGEMLATILTRPLLIWHHLTEPLRLHFLLKLFLPLGFMALFSPVVLIGAPVLAYNLLSDVPSQSSIYFQYTAPLIPFIFISAIEGVALWQKHLARRKNLNYLFGLWMLLCTAVAFNWDNPFHKPVEAPYFEVYTLQQITDADAFHRAQALIPADASVATTMTYGPHLATRETIQLFQNRTSMREFSAGFPVYDYILLNLNEGRYVNQRLLLMMIDRAIAAYGYEVIFFENDVVLLVHPKRLEDAPMLPHEREALTGVVIQRAYEIFEAGGKFVPTAPQTLTWIAEMWQVSPDEVEAIIPIEADFANGLRLLGYEHVPKRPLQPGTGVCFQLYWQRTATAVPQDEAIFFHLNAADGYVQRQRDGQPVQELLPTSQWPTDQVVVDLRCLQIPPWLQAGDYMITTGLYNPATGERVPVIAAENVPFPDAVQIEAFSLP